MYAMHNQPSRRSFLIASGLTAIASTRILGANDLLRVGVIGAGGRMGGLLNAADQVGGYQVAASATFIHHGATPSTAHERLRH